jgi:hypothetical protein
MLRDFKIFYIYVNSHVDKLFGKRKRVGYFVTGGVIVQMDDGRGMAVKGNDGSGWSSDGVVLLLGRKQNGDVVFMFLREAP